MIKNYILEVKDLIEYKVRGIISPVSMHYLAWELNRQFDFDLQRVEDHSITSKTSNSLHILYKDSLHEDSDLFLLQNKGVGGLLLPQHQVLDAILLERNYDGEFMPNFLEKIQTSSMQLCLDIDYTQLTDVEKLNLEIQ